MIKLKSLITESWDVVVGSISRDGQVKSEETSSTHTELGIQVGKPWRYNPYNHNVYWSGDNFEHDSEDEVAVENHLYKKYNYEVKSHIPLEAGNPELFQHNWMIAHGHTI